MRKRGFSATTLVLIAVLVGALFVVSKSVTPPPPGPPEPPKPQPANPMARPKQMPDKLDGHVPPGHMPDAKTMARLKLQAKNHPAQPAFNPDSIDVTSKYWTQSRMGNQGEVELQKKVAEAKAARKLQLQHNPPTPAPPVSAPMPPASNRD